MHLNLLPNKEKPLEKEKEEKWQAEVSDLLLQYQVVAISVNHEVKQVNGAAEIFSNHFIRLMHYISQKHGREIFILH